MARPGARRIPIEADAPGWGDDGGTTNSGRTHGGEAVKVAVVRFGAIHARISDDPPADIARSLAVRLRGAIRRRGSASLAVSGGSTAPSMLAALVHEDIDWDRLTIWQVDERVVPDGHADRNASQLWFVPC
jgi:hypothetical protein